MKIGYWRTADLRQRLLACAAVGALAGQSIGPTLANDPPTASPIKHLIIVIGENRSFDHVFATYKPVAGTVASKMAHPLPVSLEFWAGPGDEPVMLKIASAYEAATHHRKPPAAFPALPGETLIADAVAPH